MKRVWHLRQSIDHDVDSIQIVFERSIEFTLLKSDNTWFISDLTGEEKWNISSTADAASFVITRRASDGLSVIKTAQVARDWDLSIIHYFRSDWKEEKGWDWLIIFSERLREDSFWPKKKDREAKVTEGWRHIREKMKIASCWLCYFSRMQAAVFNLINDSSGGITVGAFTRCC